MEEEEVVLGLIPAPDWVENRPLEEGGEIELAVARKLQHYKEADQIMEIKPKKEEDAIEEITLDSEEEENQEVKIKSEEFKIEADNPFHAVNEHPEIKTAEQKQRVPVPIVFSAGQEGGEINVKQEEELQTDVSTEFPGAEEDGEISVKQEEELQIDVATEFPEAEENEEENMHADEEPHIEAVTVFSDSDEDESIQIKEEEELQIEAVTVYSDTEQSEEESLLGQENERYNMQNSGGNPFTHSVAHPQPTVVETAVQNVFGCNSCPRSFSCTAELSKHVRSHPRRGKPFVCRVCLKTDSLAANLKRHMRTHSGEKPYSCVVCFKMFTSAYSLKIHMRIHSGYKPYPCKKCPRAFYQKTDLNKHNAVHLRAETMLQLAEDLREKRDSNSLEKNVETSNLTEKVLSQCENSRVSNLPPGVCHYVLSPQLSVVPVNINSKTDESRTVNSQTESPSNLRNMPIITDVVGSFHEEDNEMQPCLSPTNSRQLQKQVAILPSNLAEKQIKMEKTVYSQPVINLVNPQVANSTGALQDTATPMSSPGGKQLAAKKSVHEQQEAYSVSSQNEANSGTTLLSPVQLLTKTVQNNANSAASAPNTAFVNSVMPSQQGGEMFCIPLIINGQMCYAIPAQTASQLVTNNPAPLQTSVQPINSHTVSAPESFLIPVFVPPISNGVPSANVSQPTTASVGTTQTSGLGNTTANQPHQIVFSSAPVSSVTCVQSENSSRSQMTVKNTVPSTQSANYAGVQVNYVKSVRQGKLQKNVGPHITTVKTYSRGQRRKRFEIPTPDVEPVSKAHSHDHHHNHDVTITSKCSNGFMQHERVFCNTCKAPVTVFTKRSKDKEVS